MPAIERVPLSGFPLYDDNKDRFAYGGRALALVCTVQRPVLGVPPFGCGPDPFQDWAVGWNYYREQVDQSFSRYFLSPDGVTWRVQQKGGTIIELGRPIAEPELGGEATDRDGANGTEGPIFRWLPVRHIDPRGNPLVFWWQKLGRVGRSFLTDVFDTPRADTPASIEEFEHHTHLTWEPHDYPVEQYVHIDRTRPDLRLARVTIASMPWQSAAPGQRELVRVYHLAYFEPRTATYDPARQSPLFHHSFLKSVRVEGSCGVPEPRELRASAPICPTLPAMTFEYESGELSGSAAGTSILGGAPSDIVANDKVIPDFASAALVDINGDGLPDIIQSWPSTDRIGETLSNAQRSHVGWLNEGFDAVRMHLSHQCIDAGGPGNTLGEPNAGKRASFLNSLFGASVIGPWADARVLWSQTGYNPVSINAAVADAAFCSEAAAEPSHPAWRWVTRSRTGWLRRTNLSTGEHSAAQWFVDVDGDGLPDLLERSDSAPSVALDAAEVNFSRQFRLGDSRGVGLLPFDPFSLSATQSAVPAAHGPPTKSWYVDVNGDGVVDLVTWEDGSPSPLVRPGDGRGRFACIGAQQACPIAADASHPWMTAAYPIHIVGTPQGDPLPGDPLPHGGWTVQYHDVTSDGLADLILLSWEDINDPTGHPRSILWTVKLWVNEDGHTFRCARPETHCRVGTIINDENPLNPEFSIRAAFADMDGNGRDGVVVLGHDGVWFLPIVGPGLLRGLADKAPRPGLLKKIDNGVGAVTEIQYSTIQHLDLEAARLGQPWTSHSPAVIPVVTKITTRNATFANEPAASSVQEPYRFERTVEYAYRDPAWDPWFRTLVGFRKIRMRTGLDRAVTEITRWFGPCQREGSACPDTSEGDPDLAMVGRVVRVDRFTTVGFDADAKPSSWLSSTVTNYTVRHPFSNAGSAPQLDSSYAFGSSTETYLYDPNAPVEPADPGTAFGGGDIIEPPPKQAARVRLVQAIDMDDRGDTIRVELDGRGQPADQPVILATHFDCNDAWQCVPKERSVSGAATPSGGTVEARRVRYGYDTGQLVTVDALLTRVESLERFHEIATAQIAPPPPSASLPGWRRILTLERDRFGNVVKSQGSGSPATCATIAYDQEYSHFPLVVSAHKQGCQSESLDVLSQYNRGQGSRVIEIQPSGFQRRLDLDPFGRIERVFESSPDGLSGMSNPLILANEYQYHDGVPISWVRVLGKTDSDRSFEFIQVRNGIGEPIMTFQRGDPSAGDAAEWIGLRWVERDTAGRIKRVLHPWFFTEDPPSLIATLAPPAIPTDTTDTAFLFDDFGRIQGVFRNGRQLWHFGAARFSSTPTIACRHRGRARRRTCARPRN
jgi:hypothetical protein